MELIVVRHGRPERIEGAIGGADPELTEIGHRQAVAMAEWLSSERIDALYVSSMVRARQTSVPLEKALGIAATVLDGIREFDDDDAAYIPMEELKQDKEAWRAMLLSHEEVDRDEFHLRTRSAMDEIVGANRGKRVAVVCHGGVINSIASDILGLSGPMFFAPDYSSLNRFMISSAGDRSVVSLNETGHLRPFPELQLA